MKKLLAFILAAVMTASLCACGSSKGLSLIHISNQSTFVVGIIIILISLFVSFNLVNSRTGRAIMAIRDNRIAAESVGINITKYKLMAFTISAAIAGAGGVLYAHNLSTLTALPANFGYNMSIMILVDVYKRQGFNNENRKK